MKHSPALIVPLPVNTFPNKLAPNVPNNIISSFCSLTLLTPFNNKPESSVFNHFQNVFHFII